MRFGPYDDGRNLSFSLESLEDRVLFLDRRCRTEGVTDPKEAEKLLRRSQTLIFLPDEERQQIVDAWCSLRETGHLPVGREIELIVLDNNMLVGYEQ